MPITKEAGTKETKEIDAPFSSNNPSHLSDEELFEIASRSPFFKEKHRRMEEILSKVDWSQVSKKSEK